MARASKWYLKIAFIFPFSFPATNPVQNLCGSLAILPASVSNATECSNSCLEESAAIAGLCSPLPCQAGHSPSLLMSGWVMVEALTRPVFSYAGIRLEFQFCAGSLRERKIMWVVYFFKTTITTSHTYHSSKIAILECSVTLSIWGL